ncbi:SWI/SNF complex 60 kDa subunit [Dichomitus squalens]|uniref:SWI/SNF complex 60 kDa subunit n=1 Tax=Dichomitus squalens TaxID=114155 RepID=A0A4V2K2S3_9APHY|nr:SWI/SNF complex 60 kDa subunit [Dichomitus squalens]TBU37743.1 SWI/SNF complex 60 kDa subunit [Dichomitus squalens]TBU51811.1 SWI/SNF complex 60 kDa subunit [Dichomitus squalens]
MEAQKPAAKKRKITDKNLPNGLLQSPEFAQESAMYRDLLQMERKLDWTMTRKRVEVHDALQRIIPATRTLRIFLSHTVSGQPWQREGVEGDATKPNPETGENIPAWQLRIDGRMLELSNQRAKDRNPPRKFSTLIKHMIVELDRDTTLYPEGNIVEWIGGPNQPQLDGFTIRRKGDAPVKIRIVLHLEQQPEQYKVQPELANIIGVKEESRIGVVQALWNYIKQNNLQDKQDRRKIHADARLRPIFNTHNNQEYEYFSALPEIVNRYLAPPEPIILHYTLNPTVAPPEKAAAWDVEVKVDDSNLKGRMQHVVVSMAQDSAKELTKLDEEIALHVQSLSNSHQKRTFLRAFEEDPRGFIQTWLASQSRDLESVLGSGPSEGATVRQEDLKRSEFFRLPWVEEAVAIQEGMRLAAKAGI